MGRRGHKISKSVWFSTLALRENSTLSQKQKVEHLNYLLSNNSLSKNRTNEQSSVHITYKHNYNKTYKHEIHTKITHIFVIFASNTYNIHIHKISYKEKKRLRFD